MGVKRLDKMGILLRSIINKVIVPFFNIPFASKRDQYGGIDQFPLRHKVVCGT